MKPDGKKSDYSLIEIADLLGRGRETVRRRLSDAGILTGHGKRYTWEQVEEAFKADDGDSGGLKDEKTREEIRKLRLANDVKEGALLKTSDVVEFMSGIVSDARTVFEQKLCNELPARGENLPAEKLRPLCKSIFDETMSKLQPLAAKYVK